MPNEKNGHTKEGWNGMACEVCHAHYPKYFLLRWLLGIVILAIVFCIGIKIGEFRGYFNSDFGRFDMRGHGGMMYYKTNSSEWPVMYPPSIPANPSTNSGTTRPSQ